MLLIFYLLTYNIISSIQFMFNSRISVNVYVKDSSLWRHNYDSNKHWYFFQKTSILS